MQVSSTTPCQMSRLMVDAVSNSWGSQSLTHGCDSTLPKGNPRVGGLRVDSTGNRTVTQTRRTCSRDESWDCPTDKAVVLNIPTDTSAMLAGPPLFRHHPQFRSNERFCHAASLQPQQTQGLRERPSCSISLNKASTDLRVPLPHFSWHGYELPSAQ